MEDGWESPAAPPPPAARDAPPPDAPVIEVMTIDDSELEETDDAKTLTFDLPKTSSDITNAMFDAARGRPATIRPPPSVSVSIKDLERNDLLHRLNKALAKELTFPDDVTTETIKRISELILKRKIPEAVRQKETLLAFLSAIDPASYTEMDASQLEDKEYWDLLFGELRQVGHGQLAELISRVLARTMAREKPAP